MLHKLRSLKTLYADTDQAGFAIILVLACIAAFSGSLVMYTRSVQGQATFASYAYRNAQFFSAAGFVGDAVMQSAMRRTEWWHEDQWSCKFGSLTLWIGARNHAGLVDLNSATEATLAAGLTALGINTSEALVTSREIAQFRTRVSAPEHQERPHLDPEFRPGPFVHPTDVYVVKALSNISYWQISDIFTVYSRTGTVATAVANGTLSKALGSAASNSEEYSLSPFSTVKVAFIKSGKTLDSWIIDYEYSSSSFRRLSTITGEVYGQKLDEATAPCSDLLAAAEVSALQEVLN